MYVLIRDLNRLRSRIGLERPRAGSLAMRHVDAGSCNGCEHELAAASGPHYDIARFGLSIVASPRHADALLVTGPVTKQMVEALRVAYAAMPEPRVVVALGDCPLGCGVLGSAANVAGPLEQIVRVDVRIPGCPPPPERIAAGLLEAMAAARSKAALRL